MSKSRIARSNRMSEPAGPGTGPVRHTGGSHSAIKHREVMSDELGREPSAFELHELLHTKNGEEGVMIDKRAQDIRDKMIQMFDDASHPSTEEGGCSSAADVDQTQLFLGLEVVNKKRRLYGVGSSRSFYVDTALSRARPSASQSHQVDEIERLVQAGIQEGLRQAKESVAAQVKESMAEMTALFRAKMEKMMSVAAPQNCPSTDPPDDDDTTAL